MSTTEHIISRRTNVETRETGNGAVLVDLTTGQVFRLNRVGAEVWGMVSAPIAVTEICTRVSARYGRPLEQVTKEVSALLEQLTREKLVEAAPAPGSP